MRRIVTSVRQLLNSKVLRSAVTLTKDGMTLIYGRAYRVQPAGDEVLLVDEQGHATFALPTREYQRLVLKSTKGIPNRPSA